MNEVLCIEPLVLSQATCQIRALMEGAATLPRLMQTRLTLGFLLYWRYRLLPSGLKA